MPPLRALGMRRHMWRLFALIWLGLFLSLSSGPGWAAVSADCPMANSHEITTSHSPMDCCADTCSSNCAAVRPGMIVPPESGPAALGDAAAAKLAAWRPDALESAELAGTDPPPRTIFIARRSAAGAMPARAYGLFSEDPLFHHAAWA